MLPANEEYIVKQYVICGPFPYKTLIRDSTESFFIDYLLELGGEGNAKLSAGMTVGNAICVKAEADERGFVDLVKFYGEAFKEFWRLEDGVAYAYTELNIEEEGSYVFLLGAEDYISVFVNGKRVFTSHVARRYEDSFYAIPVKLIKGVNRVLLKIGRLAGGWGFSLKVAKPDGPLYINKRRTIAPKPRAGDVVAEWIGVQVLAVKDTRVRLVCVEDENWNPCYSEEIALRAGERVQIPIFVTSKKNLSSNVELKLLVETSESKTNVTIPIEVSKSNHVVHTYRSRYDGSVHRYGVKIPLGFTRSRKYPAILILHGFKGIQMYSEIYGDKDWVIAVGVTARDGEVNYREIALLEILEVLENLSRRYPVDGDRVYLLGHSMGGYGAWYAGVRYPHLFAAIAPHSSRGDLSDVVDKLSKIRGWRGVAELLDTYNPARFVDNLSSTPVYIAHGAKDDIVPVEYSRRMAELLKQRGFEHVYEEVADRKHWWGSYVEGSYYGAEAIDRPQLEAFLKSKTRRVPNRVIACTDSTRFGRIWWIVFKEITGLARVDVEVDPENNTIKVWSASGLAEFAIDVKQLIEKKYIDVNRGVTLEYGGSKLLIPGSMLNEEIVVRVYGDHICVVREDLEVCGDKQRLWSRIIRREPKLPSKNILPGPFMDIFNGRTVVIPCNDAEFRAHCVEQALHLQYWWLDYSNGSIRIVDTTEVASEKLDESVNVIAIGGPEVNRYVESVIENIKPVSIEGDTIRVKNKSYHGEVYGIILVYPNPRAHYRRYLGIMGGNSLKSITALYRADLTLVPDYVVYNAERIGITLDGIVESGFFDANWE